MKKSQKKPLKGKNKFIRLEDDNLKFVVTDAAKEDRSHNNFINTVLTKERVKRYGSNGR